MPFVAKLYQPLKLTARVSTARVSAIGYSISIGAVTMIAMKYSMSSAANQRMKALKNKNQIDGSEREKLRAVFSQRINHINENNTF